tara:strand:+ start:598 stop:756 length:159 start_codon:yes stop_codon:yes gene_type:complete
MKTVKLVLLISFLFISNSFSDEIKSWEMLKEGGKVIFIRHSYAPGTGDPKNF